MKDNLTIAAIKEMLASLEKTLCLAETKVKSIRYFEDSNVVRVYLHSGFSACVDAEGYSINDILYKTLAKAEPYLGMIEEKTPGLRKYCELIFKRFHFWED